MSLIKIKEDLESRLSMPYKKIMSYIKFLEIPIVQDLSTKYKYNSIDAKDFELLQSFCQKSEAERYSIILHKNAELKYGSYDAWKKRKKQNQELALAKKLNCSLDKAFSKILEKGRASYKEKTGLDNPFQDVDHIKDSYIRNLGVSNPQKKQDIKQRSVETAKQKYNGKGCNIEKIKNTLQQKYGGIGAASDKIKQSMKRTRKQTLKEFCNDNNYILAENLSSPALVKFLCDQNNIFVTTKATYGTFIKKEDLDKVTKLINDFVPYKNSKPQYTLAEDIKQFYNGEIKINDRTAIYPKEIDIYFPDRKIGIEFNGLYWHSEQACQHGEKFHKNRHLDKTKLCEQKGIRLIHIFEGEYLFKKEIVLSIIKDALGLNKHIFARKCCFKEISNEECNNFLEKYHINGGSKSIKKAFGLIYDNDLVEVIGFGNNRFSKSRETELIRSASKDGVNIIGGLSKLIKDSKIQHFVTFADRRMFTGVSYLKSGLCKVSETAPSYYYVKGYNRENRMKYQKHKLQSILPVFDPKKSEHENMLANGYFRLYDCGTFKFEYNGEKK